MQDLQTRHISKKVINTNIDSTKRKSLKNEAKILPKVKKKLDKIKVYQNNKQRYLHLYCFRRIISIIQQ